MEERKWLEELPQNCPPDNSEIPNGFFYRLVEKFPPQINDFFSQRHLFPHRIFNTTECVANAVSIHSNISESHNLKKMKNHQNKIIIQIALDSQSGLIKKTGNNIYHYSWWVAEEFNPINVSVLKE